MLILKPGIVPVITPGFTPPVGVIRDALQWAVTIEQSVIPPYLYALYSLKPDINERIAEIIQTIVNEEMLHLALACNLLNAIGGAPKIDDPTLVQAYPRYLPGTTDPLVHLAPFSYSLVETVFKPIESPLHPIDFPCPHCPTAPKPNPPPNGETVGDLYRVIKDLLHLVDAEDPIFTGDRGRQIVEGIPGLVKVCDLKSADAAIETIVEQGEGTQGAPDTQTGEISHYYKFDEICKRYTLVENPHPTSPNDRFIFDLPKIEFEPTGVWPVPIDPTADKYDKDSGERHAIDGFNYTYTSLLKSLDLMANGRPDDFSDAFGLMFSLQEQAMGMMSGEAVPGGGSIGPTFEYLADSK